MGVRPVPGLSAVRRASGLAPGTYDVTAYFWSTRTNRFEDARTVTITVR
jgi:hypothetical protein